MQVHKVGSSSLWVIRDNSRDINQANYWIGLDNLFSCNLYSAA